MQAQSVGSVRRRIVCRERPEDVAAGFHVSFSRLVADTTQQSLPRGVHTPALALLLPGHVSVILGVCMVSSERTCAAWCRHDRTAAVRGDGA